MLSFAGSTTGFPVIGHGRDAASTSAWLARYLGRESDDATARYAARRTRESPSTQCPRLAISRTTSRWRKDGRIVVTGMFSHRMWVLDPARGTFEGVDIPVEKANPRALEIDAAGDWWVVFGARHMVARYSPKTRSWRTWPGGFYPHSLALARDGGVWINGHFTHSPELIARIDTTVRDSSRALTRFEVPAHPTLGKGPGGPIPYEIRVAPERARVDVRASGQSAVRVRSQSTRRSTCSRMPEPWSGPRRFDIDRRGILWIPGVRDERARSTRSGDAEVHALPAAGA